MARSTIMGSRARGGAPCSWAIHPPDGPGPPWPLRAAAKRPFGFLRGGEHDPPVHPGRLSAGVDLRHPAHAHQRVAQGPEHQLLQVPDLVQIPAFDAAKILLASAAVRSARPGPSPLVPARVALRSVHLHGVQLALRRWHPSVLSPPPHQTRVSALSTRAPALFGRVVREPLAGEPAPGSRFPLPFGHRPSLLESSCPAGEFSFPHGRPTAVSRRPHRGFHVPHAIDAAGWASSCPGAVVRSRAAKSSGRRPPPYSGGPLFSRLLQPTGGVL